MHEFKEARTVDLDDEDGDAGDDDEADAHAGDADAEADGGGMKPMDMVDAAEDEQEVAESAGRERAKRTAETQAEGEAAAKKQK